MRAEGLSPAQQTQAEIIERVLRARGVPVEVVYAAVVNAYAESRLNPLAKGDNGRSVGLFQLSERGAGAGMSVAARQDPETNTSKIADVYFGSQGRPVRLAYAKGERSVEALSALWSTHVERPSDKPGEETKRRAFARKLYPRGSSTTGLDRVYQTGSRPWAPWLMLVAGTVLVGVGMRRRG